MSIFIVSTVPTDNLHLQQHGHVSLTIVTVTVTVTVTVSLFWTQLVLSLGVGPVWQHF